MGRGQAAAPKGEPVAPTPCPPWGSPWAARPRDGGTAAAGFPPPAEPPSAAPRLPLKPLEPVPARVSPEETQRMILLVSQLSAQQVAQQVAHTLCGLSLGLLCGG